MLVPSYEIPQADILTDVVKTVIAVSNGAQTYQEISDAINKSNRQGRYYRKAAEITGLIKTPQRNASIITALGKSFLNTNPSLKNPYLLKGVLNSRIFQRIIPFLENNLENGVTKSQIENFISKTADLGAPTMAPRRITTVISWLTDLNILYKTNNKYYLSADIINDKLENVEFNKVDEPLLPSVTELSEYETVQKRASEAKETITSSINFKANERAEKSHRNLVNLASKKIKEAGAIPKYNQLIDLATKHEGHDYIFEMKSTTAQNEKSQIRSGLAQLYEYRYLQNKPSAKLVLIIENPLSDKEAWRSDYLIYDRDILLIWNGKGDQLYGDGKTLNELSFLNIQ